MNPVKPVRVASIVASALVVCALATPVQSIAQSPPPPGRAAARVTEANVRAELSALAADSMEGRFTAAPGGARAARYIAEQMRAAGLKPAGDSGYFQRVPVSIERGFLPRPVASFAIWDTLPAATRGLAVNVIGILPGELSDSVIVVDAHYDHNGVAGRGTCRAQGADSICNGADDDASGTVAVIEIAKALAAGPKLHRTVIFAATTGEEVGLIGTRWYIAHPAVPLANMTANLEIEMIDRPDSLAGGPGRAWLTGYERSTMGEMFTKAGLPVEPDKRVCQGFFERSDNIAFARAGIPAHTLSTFDLHADYHTVKDESSLANIPHMTAVIRAAVSGVELLANGTSPQWRDGMRPPTSGQIPSPPQCSQGR
ncbi:MAG TPA: M20/M25/M40 family metallo-hydrolase [Gemmatimonadaceae bacterium]|nr:M20/M25/M40 family metallo-hydrolase [Gemmatimonadaceae bacterium]